MPDDRDTQTAAPSTDGDTTSTQATATALQDPPASEEAAGAETQAATTDSEAKAEAPAAANGAEPKATETEDGKTEAAKTEAAKTEASEPEAAEASEPKTEAAEAEASAAESAPEPDADRRSPEPDSQAVEDQIQADATSDETSAKAESKAEPEKAEAKAEKSDKAEETTEAKAEKTDAKAEAKGNEKADETTEAKAEKTDNATAAPEAKAEKAEDTAQKTEAKTESKGDEKADDKAEAKSEKKADAKAEAEAEKKTEKKADAKAADGKASDEKAEAGDKEKKEPELDDPALKELRKAKEDGTTVSGKVIGWNRGGFHVVIDEITAFCPASEMELGRPRSPETYMDREMDFKVAKFQRRGRRVVLSRSDLLKNKRDELLAGLKPGTVTKGVVTSLPDFGAFVDLGGVEGLVHVSEISRSRVKHPRDVLKSGQEVEVKVLKVEKGGDRISLSMKELEPDPWKGVAESYPRGSKFEGKILRHADFGMFVELEPDVEGLVHVSQLAPGVNMNADELKPGSTLEGWIREVDTKRGRISLSMREVPEDDPWKSVSTTLPEGEMVDGVVESIAPFGVFINLAPGLTGLLPNSQTGLPRGTNPNRAFNPGSTVSVQILAVDPKRKRISLGREGSRVEATKADLQEFKQQQKQAEPNAPSAMEAAFAALGFGDGDES